MRESLRDPLRLDHIKAAIENLLNADSGYALDEVHEKDLEYFGVVKLLEIIGEAAYKLTDDFKQSHPETPWKIIVGMRNVLVHGYYQIKREDVIKTIRQNLRPLYAQICAYLEEFDI